MFESASPWRRLIGVGAMIAFPALTRESAAQSVADHLALGDREHAAMNAPVALRHYQEAVRVDPRSYEALWKASREAVDVGEHAPIGPRDSLYVLAEQYARRAVEANVEHPEGHFQLARSIGKKLLSVPNRDRVRCAAEVRLHALDALQRDPRHAGALHVMGMWNYNIMSLNGMARFMVKNFLGGKVFDTASWNEAQRYMEAAVAAEPDRLVHHLDLARVYAARGDHARARAEYELTLRGARTDFNDQRYQAAAAEELRTLK